MDGEIAFPVFLKAGHKFCVLDAYLSTTTKIPFMLGAHVFLQFHSKHFRSSLLLKKITV